MLLALSACKLNVERGDVEKGKGGGDDGPRDDDGDGYTSDEDCDDLDSTAHPGADELCDGRDNDCDELVDEDDAVDPDTFWADADGDGYGDPATELTGCEAPSGAVDNDDDCDDTDADLNPGTAWYRDRDQDGYGDPETAQYGCSGPESSIRAAGDCDDRDEDIHPGADERCNAVDDDCDGVIDPPESVDAPSWYADVDADGYGDPDAVQSACTQPSGTTADDRDCDDTLAEVYPGATEYCNGIDDDCDDSIDESGAVDASLWYDDDDGDGYGDPAASTRSCAAPSGTVADDTDCDDAEATTNPGATEYCDGHDDDCDGSIDEADAADATTWYGDADADGYGATGSGSTIACDAPAGYAASSTDCDDSDDHIHPGATELCDGADTDCDSSTGESGRAAFNASGSWQDVTAILTGTPSTAAAVGIVSDGELWMCDGTWYVNLYLDADIDVIGANGAGSTTLDGAGDGPVVSIDTGGVVASIQGVTLTNGSGGTSSSGAYEGGGVHCETSGTLTLTDAVVTLNDATEGGGIRSDGCDLAMDNVEISDNAATWGGGLSLYDGTAELVDCELTGNSASSWGGGVELYASGGDVTLDLDGTWIHDNDGGGNGGGIFAYEVPYDIDITCDGTRSTLAGIYDNTADYGGGVFLYSGDLTGSTCDMGTGSSDNDPSDIQTRSSTYSYGNNASFSCTGTGSCTP